jgi:hypothetical protein
MSPVTRREILLGGGVLVLAGAGWGVNSRVLRRHREDVLEILIASIQDPTQLVAVGESYLAAHPNESDKASLDGLILPDLGPFGWGRDLNTTQQDFAARITQDFTTGDLVELEGWQYSRTEARFAAWVALSRREGS